MPNMITPPACFFLFSFSQSLTDRLDSSFVARRERELERFLRDVGRAPFQCCEEVSAFFVEVRLCLAPSVGRLCVCAYVCV